MDLQAELDDITWVLLWELQEDARQPTAELARKVGLTPSAVRQRIQRLEKEGIITGYHAVVNAERIGLPIPAFIRVTTSGEKSAFLITFVKQCPEVLECHKVTSQEGFIVKVVVASLPHLDHLINLLEKYGNCITSVVLTSPVTRRSLSRDILKW